MSNYTVHVRGHLEKGKHEGGLRRRSGRAELMVATYSSAAPHCDMLCSHPWYTVTGVIPTAPRWKKE